MSGRHSKVFNSLQPCLTGSSWIQLIHLFCRIQYKIAPPVLVCKYVHQNGTVAKMSHQRWIWAICWTYGTKHTRFGRMSSKKCYQTDLSWKDPDWPDSFNIPEEFCLFCGHICCLRWVQMTLMTSISPLSCPGDERPVSGDEQRLLTRDQHTERPVVLV